MKFDYKALAASDAYKAYKQGLYVYVYVYKNNSKSRIEEANTLFRRLVYVLVQENQGDTQAVIDTLGSHESQRTYNWFNYYIHVFNEYRTISAHYRRNKLSKKERLRIRHYRARALRKSSGKKPRRRSP